MYQGEVNVKHEDLPTFLKVAQMLQIKGLVGGEEQIIPLLNDYVSMLDPPPLDSENININLSDIPSESRSRTSDESTHSHRITKKNTRTRKKQGTPENDYDSIKKLKTGSDIDSKDDICLLSDNNEKDMNDSNSEKNIEHNETTEAINDSKKIIDLSNEQNLEENSLLEPGTYVIMLFMLFYCVIYVIDINLLLTI